MADMPESYDEHHITADDLLLMFTCVTSKGGRYDDASFAAGFQCGQLHERLSSRRVAAMSTLVRTPLVEQVDAIAMLHGYTTDVLAGWDDWTHVGFTRVDEDPVPRR